MKSALFALVLCTTTAVACGPSETVSPDPDALVVPAGWPTVDSGCQFRFRAPPEMKKQDVQGIDSCVGSYEGAGLSLGLDYGGFSDPLHYEGRPGYREHSVRIDGRLAKVMSFGPVASGGPYVAAAHFDLGSGLLLTLWISARDEAALALARKVIYSVDFP